MILFVDDEPKYVAAYTQAFELSQFEVKMVPAVDEAWQILESQKEDVDAIILDVMMPHGRLFDMRETQDGLRTGLLFVEKLRQFDERIPVVLLTNANKNDFGEIPHRNCLIYEKKDIDPWSLVDKMSEIKRRAKLDD